MAWKLGNCPWPGWTHRLSTGLIGDRRDVADLFPLSPMQEGMLFHSLFEPGKAAYFLQLHCRLEGPLDGKAFQRAWQAILDRHPALRCSFHWQDLKRPLQMTHENLLLPWLEEDLGDLPQPEQQRRLETYLKTDLEAEFQLQSAPLMRIALFHLDGETRHFILSLHHLLMDGWSFAIVIKELFALYEGFCQNAPVELPEPGLFRNYIQWRERQNRDLARDFWRQKLAGFKSPNGLPGRIPGPRKEGAVFANRSMTLSDSLTSGLAALARENRTTVNTLFQGAWSLLLGNYTRSQDLVFGVTVSGRPAELPAVGDTVGLFINTQPVRVNAEDRQFLVPWLQELHRQQAAQEPFHYCSLIDIQGWSEIPREIPLFESILVFENHPMTQSMGKAPSGPLAVEIVDNFEFANYPLSVVVVPGPQWSLTLSYDGGYFEVDQVDRMLSHVHCLLNSMVENPRRKLHQFPLLSQKETKRILSEWNDTERRSLARKPVHLFFEDMALQQPHAVAARCRNRDISYQILNQKANGLARQLIQLGVGPESVVALLVKRNLDLAITLLAVFKAGGAFLPLNSQHPLARVRVVLKGSGAALLLASRHFNDRVENLVQGMERPPTAHIIEDLLSCETATDNLEPRCELDHLAYVIYTSGSTGVPKGAMLEQKGMLNHIASKIGKLQLNKADVISQDAALTFDIAVWQTMAALVVGGRVEIFPDEISQDPVRLLEQVLDRGITVLEIVPSVLAVMLAEYIGHGRNSSNGKALRWLLSSGETLSPDLCGRWLERFPGTPIVNMWGATEASDDVTYVSLVSPPAPHSTHLSIGRPADNVSLYILDTHMQPVPVNVPGELFIGGPAVGRGYLNRPGGTAVAFVPNPFSPVPGDRLYKSGDLGSYRSDGHPIFHGRVDFQVKIRGFRIELGEIERALTKGSAVREAVVMVQETKGDKHLVAYLVPSGEAHQTSLESGSDSEQNKADQWEKVWDEVYEQGSFSQNDATLNTQVWVSSYTGEAVPEPEIFEAVEDSVARMLRLKAQDVLELGCGTGLILSRLLGHCRRYVGTDVSKRALQSLAEQVPVSQSQAPKISLFQGAADNFDQIPQGAFDLVIINEVVQYFPSIHYLIRVLQGAVKCLRPGGTLFLGGVRNLKLLRAFHTSLQLHKAPEHTTVTDLLQRVDRALAQEKELLVDPAFFEQIQTVLPQINGVRMELKGGRHHNEFTGFRYDVFLGVNHQLDPDEPSQTLHWRQEGFTLERLKELLERDKPACLEIDSIPNLRLAREEIATEILESGDRPHKVGDLLGELEPRLLEHGGVEPADLWDLGETHPFHVQLFWSDGEWTYKARFKRRENASEPGKLRPCSQPAQGRSLDDYANQPLRRDHWDQLVADCKKELLASLPETMIPSAFVVLEELPLTQNGKLDRKALPLPDLLKAGTENDYVAPRSALERQLAAIWIDLLGVAQVGIHDSFFELGGHSLLATQVVSRIRRILDVELPLRTLFQAPTIGDLGRRIEQLQQVGKIEQLPPIKPLPRSEAIPLSYAQQRLWILDRMMGGSAAYNVPVAFHLHGALDLAGLEHSLTQITRRHETLRTTFDKVDGNPVQVVHEAAKLRLNLVHMMPDSHDQVAAYLAKDRRTAFNLQRGPLLRLTLYRLALDHHLLSFNMHHIITDGWSVGILVKEFTALYTAWVRRGDPGLKPLPVQYADYGMWQRQWLEKDQRQLKYWEGTLAHLPVLEFPTDRIRPPVRDYAGSSLYFNLDPGLSQRLLSLSKGEGLTPFMVLLTAFNLLLSRYSGQRDIAVGTDIANRNREEIEGQIGFFINQLVLRTDLNGNPSLRRFLARVRHQVLEAFAHQDCPFDLLVSRLVSRRDRSRAPLFDVKLIVQNAPLGALSWPGLNLVPANLKNTVSEFDMTLIFTETGDGMAGQLIYDTHLFRESTAKRMVAQFQTLLEGMVGDPDQTIEDLPLLCEADRQQLLVEWNQTDVTFAGDTLLDAFTRNVNRHPHGVAAMGMQNQVMVYLTFAELDRRSNQLAHYLVDLGVEEEAPVGLCLDRSPEFLVGLLGILKAGGVYLPLDATAPPERLSHMLEDASPVALVTHEAKLDLLPSFQLSFMSVVSLDADWEMIADESIEAPVLACSPHRMAYLIYTSGSSGLPKAVAVSHRNLFYSTMARTRFYGEPMGAFLMVSPFTFDSSMVGIFWSMTAGGALVLPPEDHLKDLIQLGLWVHRSGASHWLSVPSLYKVMLEANQQELKSLKVVIMAGEALPRALVDMHGQLLPGVAMYNEYGPTEATVWATGLSCIPPGEQISIGRPVANTRLYIVDDMLRPVPRGAKGELLIGGRGLTRGYFIRPALTAASFIPNPFASTDHPSESRLYKTGDLGRYLPEGEVAFLGRKDNQIKIRGYRIELN